MEPGIFYFRECAVGNCVKNRRSNDRISFICVVGIIVTQFRKAPSLSCAIPANENARNLAASGVL